MGASDVIGMDTELDYTFPKYKPNPEDVEMLHSMAAAVREHGADLTFGFDGDGCGVVDDEGEEIFADKIGLMLASDLAPLNPSATFVADGTRRASKPPTRYWAAKPPRSSPSTACGCTWKTARGF